MSNVVQMDHKQVVHYLERALEAAREGDLIEVVIMGRCKDGDTYMAVSGSYNPHEMAGKMLDAAVLRLGYQLR